MPRFKTQRGREPSAIKASAIARRITSTWAVIALLALATACGPETAPSRTGPVWTPRAPVQTITGQAATSAQEVNWPVFDFDAAHSGVNPDETAITPASVGSLHRLWTSKLPQVADSTPILLHNLALPDGTHRDVLYLTTSAGTLVALDAATGARLWAATTSGPHITNSSPAADPSGAFVYSYGLDGQLHKYRATTGEEITGHGWPIPITHMTDTEKESSALNVANGYIYVTTSGYLGDAPPYQGHIVAINLINGAVHVFNSLCSNITHVLARGECPDDRSGIWARAGVVVDPVTGNLFVTTGNGPYTANQGGTDWGDSVLELSGDGTRLLDSYTPTNFAELEQTDTDLGSTAPALLPAIPDSRMPYLAVQGGKDGLLRLLNRQNLSGQGGPGHVGGALQTIAAPGSCGVFTQPAIWTDPGEHGIWLFVTSTCAIGGYQIVVSRGQATVRQVWSVQQEATSPVIAGNVLFAATTGQIFALDPRTGHQLWSSTRPSAGGSIGGIHWESPIVVNGHLYCSDQDGYITAYGL
jgi:outer membrane protein assembly factor BamB